ncbi:hypothetical protein [Mesorhizobium sp. M7A.F.Ca.MR.362.00.0.0]|uniref:hypothetical protein n=1 Tax=Mesorhizobium sp. M7A.F.Ca.MR.362.00.0.0 TaxID=2496779 RepID=UPI000FD46D71|nr:hypothetical protein [Mesorhizobium sp. M7A.F.Ca.MR.362.00.0.0]RUU79026.1 hypothetical protein EOC06_17640 [Mesorhizobium sp. M7A.F.Ca.MR.362.00.0.0]RWN95114.1 MAG: hypothetical protein EOS05_09945 [Mesorhizobium sp.]
MSLSVVANPATVQAAGYCIRELTLALEFIATTLRAVADGHQTESHMVQTPFVMALGKLNDLTPVIIAKAA